MTKFEKPKGINFSCVEKISADDFSAALTKIVRFIKNLDFFHSFQKLQRYDDWWEHDGLHFHKNSITFEDLFRIVSSPKLLSEAMPGDWYVFVGIAPTNNEWYLRFYINNEDEDDLVTNFDVTFSNEISEKFKIEVLSKLNLQIKEQEAENYYQTIIL